MSQAIFCTADGLVSAFPIRIPEAVPSHLMRPCQTDQKFILDPVDFKTHSQKATQMRIYRLAGQDPRGFYIYEEQV